MERSYVTAGYLNKFKKRVKFFIEKSHKFMHNTLKHGCNRRMNIQLVILDRDGVINHDSDNYIKTTDEWQPIEGSLEAIARLTQAHIKIGIATNQSGVARGLFSQADLDAMHTKMQNLITAVGGKINALELCPHGPDENCACRKPKPEMLLRIMKTLRVVPEQTLFVGDSFKDFEAATAANVHFALVKTGKGERTLAQHADALQDTRVYATLWHLVNDLLE
jgi:D-glycero-D-manno-heptose 1,7-bisphosphate phosphatase